MALTKLIKPEMAYLKCGLYGGQGAGKTRTASEIAIGLHKLIKSKKGVAFYDTETGSNFMSPLFNKHNIDLFVEKSKSFVSLRDTIIQTPQFADILIIDSITHPWRELVKSYKAARHQKFLRIQDWGPLKEEWQQFSDLFVNSHLHIILCGRASNVFEDVEDSDDDGNGKSNWKAVKVGTKMATETETGYEPSLLIEMQKLYLQDGGKYVRRASVIKDRFGVIDSKDFDFGPEDKEGYVFSCFLPHISLLNLGGDHVGIDVTKNSEGLFGDGGRGWAENRRRAEIFIEEIDGLFKSYIPGQGPKEKKIQADVFNTVFQTRSMKAIGEMRADDLQHGKEAVEYILMQMVKNAPWIAKMQEDKTQSFDLAQWISAQFNTYLSSTTPAAAPKPDPDDDIPIFTSTANTEAGHVPGNQAPPAGGVAPKPEGPAPDQTKPALSPEEKQALDVAVTRDIESALMDAKTPNDADTVFADYGTIIAALSEENRKRIHRAYNNKKRQLKRGGEGSEPELRQ